MYYRELRDRGQKTEASIFFRAFLVTLALFIAAGMFAWFMGWNNGAEYQEQSGDMYELYELPANPVR